MRHIQSSKQRDRLNRMHRIDTKHEEDNEGPIHRRGVAENYE